jgi:dTDP-4-dehydrorhamnose reductase
MRVLVIGGTGYLGSELVRQGATGLGSADVDVRDARAVARALASHEPELVVNCAYRQDTPDMWEVNRDGAANVARAAAEAGVRLVHLSTDVVFGGAKGRYTEDDDPDPVTDYGRSKAAAEPLVLDAHPGALVVRTSLIYGGPGFEPSKHERAARDPANTFFTDERRSPVQVGDLAAAVLMLAQGTARGILHVAGADDVSRCDFARLVADDEVRCGPVPAGAIRPRDCTLDSSRAQRLLALRLRGCREVLAVES